MAAVGRFANPLRIPPLLEGVPGTDGKVYDLNVAPGKSEFLSGRSTPTLGINGAYLGPTIRCRTSDRVTMRVRNSLTEPTTLHWHGLHLPAASDGGPHQVVEPGTVWETSFAIKQAASLCWYHSHLMEQTGEQVLRGLAGLFLIEDDQSKSLRLPSDYGVDDIPLVIQDRRFNSDGSFDYDLAMHDVMMGYKGNVVLVNGTVDPHVALRRQRTRLRILNGSNSRIYTLGRDDGADIVAIASDGGLLEQPARLRRVRLGPGERIELLVDMQAGQTVRLMSYPDRVVAGGMGRGMMMGGMAGNSETFPIIELRAERLETAEMSFPERLIQVPNWTAAQAARTRTFSLDMPMMGMGGMMGGAGMGGAMGINGRAMDMGRIDERVSLGSIEIWRIRNTTPLAHPFHIHGVQFRTLDRDGGPPLPQERGLKDTVMVDPDSVVRVITEFSDFSDPRRPYMYHCHILEHEDAGMMGQFVVV
ncbi:MAG: multicopper oxidase domain-containing protein [Bradyrhizobium sp.]|nr:multicopper oxidase domain-containing protein [Bradyrhizobium sp.]